MFKDLINTNLEESYQFLITEIKENGFDGFIINLNDKRQNSMIQFKRNSTKEVKYILETSKVLSLINLIINQNNIVKVTTLKDKLITFNDQSLKLNLSNTIEGKQLIVDVI